MYKTKNYTITRENLPIHELMGLPVEIVHASDASAKGISGMIVDETQKTFLLETKKGEKRIPKDSTVFAFDLNGEIVKIPGNELLHTPIERLKIGGKVTYG